MEFYQIGITLIIFMFIGTFTYFWVTKPDKSYKSNMKIVRYSGSVKTPGMKNVLSRKRNKKY